MKLIEAMKKLKVILKRIQNNTQRINDYAAVAENERIHFESTGKQAKEIRSLIQANKDLLHEYLNLKKKIEFTNLVTKVKVEGEEFSISELLILKRSLANLMMNTFNALNDNGARSRLGRQPVRHGEKEPVIEKYWDETEKNEGLRHWSDIYHGADSQLEIVNATTDLLDFDSIPMPPQNDSAPKAEV